LDKVQCIPCAICDEYAAKNALANGAQITTVSAAVRDTDTGA
jgi:formate hydrogenlyase subunit 6/NADH:ubiquinone oxidoreductase subunit I